MPAAGSGQVWDGITLELDPLEVQGRPSYVVWGMGDVATHAAKVDGLSAVCSVPEGVFTNPGIAEARGAACSRPRGTGLSLDPDPGPQGGYLRGEDTPRRTCAAAHRARTAGKRPQGPGTRVRNRSGQGGGSIGRFFVGAQRHRWWHLRTLALVFTSDARNVSGISARGRGGTDQGV